MILIFVRVYECDRVCRCALCTCVFMCVRSKFSLHANRPVSLHMAWATIQAIQRRTNCRSQSRKLTVTAEYLIKKYTKNNKILCPLSLTPAIIHFCLLLTGNRCTLKRVAASASEHEISELCCRRKRCAVELHPLLLQRASARTLNHVSTSFFLPACTSGDKYPSLHRLCEGYRDCLLNNRHVWNTILKPRRPAQPR